MGKNDNRRGLKMRRRIRQGKLKARMARKVADAKEAGLKAKAAAGGAAATAAKAAADKKKPKKKAAAEAASE